VKYIKDLLKDKTLEQQKEYLENHRSALGGQLMEITMQISNVEKKLQEKRIESMVAERLKTLHEPVRLNKSKEVITLVEYEDIMYELRDYPEIVIGIQNHFNIDSIAELPQVDLPYVKNKVRAIKRQHEGHERLIKSLLDKVNDLHDRDLRSRVFPLQEET
jgi:hypothetical protein